MGVNNYGLGLLGSFIRGETPITPTTAIFDTGSTEFKPDVYNAEDERYRAVGVWTPLDIVDSRFTVIVPTTDLVGSLIYSTGLATGSTDLGSDMVARQITAFGEKTLYQNWILNFDWRNRSV